MIFVFGSNLAGRHGKGAALEALQNWGAKYGQGEGPQGRSYAIPTKDETLIPLGLDIIRSKVQSFLRYSELNYSVPFYVTPIGTGLAGYRHEEIAPMFRGHLRNVIIVCPEWKEILSLGCRDDES